MTKNDLEFLRRRIEDSTREWRVGDRCLPFKGTEPTTVIKVDGQKVFLANGQSGHVTRMGRVTERGK